MGVLLAGQSAQAQNQPLIEVVAAPVQDDERLALSRRLAQLTTAGMDKVVGQAIQAEMAQAREMDDEHKRWFVTNAPPIMSRHMPSLIDTMVVDYAQRFTTAELQAMVGFYDTPAGRDIALKQLEAGAAMGPSMVQFQMAFLTDLVEKYCASFECETEAATVKKNDRR